MQQEPNNSSSSPKGLRGYFLQKQLIADRDKLLASFSIGLLVLAAGVYLIVTHASSTTATGQITGIASKCLDNYRGKLIDGNKIQLWQCTNGAAQIWTLPGDSTIHFGASKYCLDTKAGATTPQTTVVLQQCNGSTSQQWHAKNGTLVNGKSGLCLEDKRARVSNGNPIWINTCNGADAQKWAVPQPPAADTGGTTAPPTSSSGGTTSSTATGTTTCPLPKYPTPTCTGIPAGTTFAKTINGNYTATTAGEVIDGWHITGSLTIMASNVVIRNSQIDGTVDNEVGTTHYTPFTISHTTIGPETGCIGSPGLGEDGFTAQSVYIRGHDDGFRMSGNNITISDSYAKLCYLDASLAPPDGSHSDGIQAYCPDRTCTGLTFNHNTIDARGIPATFMLNLVDPNLSVVSANDNLLAGGAYTIVPQWHSGSKWVLHNNRIVDGAWTYGPISAEGTCSQQDWAGNSIVTVDADYNITSTVKPTGCID